MAESDLLFPPPGENSHLLSFSRMLAPPPPQYLPIRLYHSPWTDRGTGMRSSFMSRQLSKKHLLASRDNFPFPG